MSLTDALGPGPEEEIEAPEAHDAEIPSPVVEEAKPDNPAASKERPEGFVPHEALHEQREYNKRLQAELSDQRKRSERMEETFQRLVLGINEKATTPPPKLEEDPLGHFQHRNQSLEQEIAALKQEVANTKTMQTQQTQDGQVFAALQAAESQFKSKTPDYDTAAQFLRNARQEELADLGVPPEQIGQVIYHEVKQLTQSALAQGKNPADLAYKMAQRRGYKPATVAAKSNIETLSKATDASKTLGGGGSAGPITKLADLAQLSNEDLDALIKDDKKWNRLMKGQPVQ